MVPMGVGSLRVGAGGNSRVGAAVEVPLNPPAAGKTNGGVVLFVGDKVLDGLVGEVGSC